VLSCGACVLLFGGLGLLVGGVNTTVNQYYQAVEQQNYATAYGYLRVESFTRGNQNIVASENTYASIASTLDNQNGKVTSHNIKSTNITNNVATVLVDVTRGGRTYQVNLQLQKFGNDWKITRFDNV